MSNYNIAMRSIATLLSLKNDELPGLLQTIDETRFTRSRVKSYFYSPTNNKYRHATKDDFVAFLSMLSVTSELSKFDVPADESLMPNAVSEWLSQYIDELPRMALSQILLIGTDVTSEQGYMYSQQLGQLCLHYRDCGHNQGAFEASSDIATERFLGVLWAACSMGNVEQAIFTKANFNDICDVVKRDLSKHFSMSQNYRT